MLHSLVADDPLEGHRFRAALEARSDDDILVYSGRSTAPSSSSSTVLSVDVLDGSRLRR